MFENNNCFLQWKEDLSIPGIPQLGLNNVKTEVIFAKSHDNCMIPMSIFTSPFTCKGIETKNG